MAQDMPVITTPTLLGKANAIIAVDKAEAAARSTALENARIQAGFLPRLQKPTPERHTGAVVSAKA